MFSIKSNTFWVSFGHILCH